MLLDKLDELENAKKEAVLKSLNTNKKIDDSKEEKYSYKDKHLKQPCQNETKNIIKIKIKNKDEEKE